MTGDNLRLILGPLLQTGDYDGSDDETQGRLRHLRLLRRCGLHRLRPGVQVRLPDALRLLLQVLLLLRVFGRPQRAQGGQGQGVRFLTSLDGLWQSVKALFARGLPYDGGGVYQEGE